MLFAVGGNSRLQAAVQHVLPRYMPHCVYVAIDPVSLQRAQNILITQSTSIPLVTTFHSVPIVESDKSIVQGCA